MCTFQRNVDRSWIRNRGEDFIGYFHNGYCNWDPWRKKNAVMRDVTFIESRKAKFLLFRRFCRVVITSVCLKVWLRAKEVPRRMRIKRVLTAVLMKLSVKAA